MFSIEDIVELPITIICEPMQELTQKPEAMLRWRKMRGGSIACFGFQTWIKTKVIKSAKASTSNAMIRPALH